MHFVVGGVTAIVVTVLVNFLVSKYKASVVTSEEQPEGFLFNIEMTKSDKAGYLTGIAMISLFIGMMVMFLNPDNNVLFISILVFIIILLLALVACIFLLVRSTVSKTIVTNNSLIIISMGKQKNEVFFSEITLVRETMKKLNMNITITLSIMTKKGVVLQIKSTRPNYQKLVSLLQSNNIAIISA